MAMQGSDAGISLDGFMKGEINLRQAAWNAKPKDSPQWKRFASTHSGVRWRHVRNKINKFKAKFRKSKLSLDEFIEKNRAEYNNVARELKYGKFYRKSHIHPEDIFEGTHSQSPYFSKEIPHFLKKTETK